MATHVIGDFGNQGFGLTATATLTGLSVGDKIVVFLRERDGSVPSVVASDLDGAFTNSVNNSDADSYERSYWLDVATAGTHVVEVTFGGNSVFGFYADGYGGLASGAPTQTNFNDNASGLSHSHGSITTTGPGLITTGLGRQNDTGAPLFAAAGFDRVDTAYRSSRQYKLSTGAETTDAEITSTNPITSVGIILFWPDAVAPVVLEQEGFRFGADDDSESAHTWLDAQDASVTQPLGTRLLLRALVDADEDPASTPFTLRYQKNGSGGYIPVPVGSGTPETFAQPTWGAIGTGANGSTSCTPSYPAGISASTSKLYCMVASGASTEPTPTMPAGWTQIGTLSGGSGATYAADAGNRRVTWFRKDTVDGTESGTVTVSNTGGNTMRALIMRIEVPSGYEIQEQFASGQDGTHGTSWSVTASAAVDLDADRLVLVGTAQSTDAATQSAQAISASGITFGTRTNRASTAVTTGNDHRFVLDSVPVSSGSGTVAPTWSHTNSANASGPTTFLVLRARLAGTVNEVYVDASPNITAGGEATTARLTAPSGKTTSDFTTGRRWDDENGSDGVDIAADFYTELEWALNTQAPAVDGDYFDFRVYADAAALDSYTVTPRWTLGTPSGLTADGALTTAASVLAASAAVQRTGAGALTTPATDLAAAATIQRSASGAVIVPPAGLAASATIPRAAAAAITAPGTDLASAVDVDRSAAGAVTLPGADLAAAADITRQVAGAVALPSTTMAAAATVSRSATGVMATGAVTLAASGAVVRSASGALEVPALVLAGQTGIVTTAAGVLAVGAVDLEASAAVSRTASGALVPAALTVQAAGTVARVAAAVLTLDPVTLTAAATGGRSVSGSLQLAPATLEAAAARAVHVEAVVTLPAVDLAAVLSVVRFASGELALVVPVLAGVTAGQALTAVASIVTPAPVLDADALIARTAAGAATLAAPVLAGDAVRQIGVAGVVVLRGPALSAALQVARTASGDIDLAAVVLQGTAILGILQPLLLTVSTVTSLTPTRHALSLTPARRATPLTPSRTAAAI